MGHGVMAAPKIKAKTKGGNISVSYVAVPLAVIFLNILIIIFPKETVAAAKDGAKLWFETVLPSLAPFVIGMNILYATGAVRVIGSLLEPLMRPVFNVPGCGGFALAAGVLSGYPMGAKAVCDLRNNGDITKPEAQRLISFAGNAGPLFILGAVASGMFGNAYIGYFIITAHILAALTVGVMFRFYKSGGAVTPRRPPGTKVQPRPGKKAPIGAVLGQSVSGAMETLLLTGGFIILFSVVVKALDITGVFNALPGNFISSPGVAAGFAEMTNGCARLAQAGISKGTVIAAAAVISWGGLSVHAQTLALIGKTDINAGLYLLAKLAHALMAVLYGIIIYPFFKNLIENPAAVETSAKTSLISPSGGELNRFAYGIVLFGVCGAVVLAAVIIIQIVIHVKKHIRAV